MERTRKIIRIITPLPSAFPIIKGVTGSFVGGGAGQERSQSLQLHVSDWLSGETLHAGVEKFITPNPSGAKTIKQDYK